MDITFKGLCSAAAIALTFILYYPYVRSILRGTTRPHVISWVIWSVATLIVFFAQLADGAGIGAWPIGVSALITIYVGLLSWKKRADLSITPLDWGCLAVALMTVPLWYLTASPLWAAVILTVIDLIGFGPTIRKAYSRPHEERAWFFLLGGVRNGLVVLALEHYSLTTAIFPAAVGVGCLGVAGFILMRRAVASTPLQAE